MPLLLPLRLSQPLLLPVPRPLSCGPWYPVTLRLLPLGLGPPSPEQHHPRRRVLRRQVWAILLRDEPEDGLDLCGRCSHPSRNLNPKTIRNSHHLYLHPRACTYALITTPNQNPTPMPMPTPNPNPCPPPPPLGVDMDAMENQGLLTYAPQMLLLNPNASALPPAPLGNSGRLSQVGVRVITRPWGSHGQEDSCRFRQASAYPRNRP